ncbi:hypothetical protein DV532_00995 [Pseudomonas sp. Leaf58]|nr:hypothetical protein DV532_00995 [Pseudomonas sp. Leaf58]
MTWWAIARSRSSTTSSTSTNGTCSTCIWSGNNLYRLFAGKPAPTGTAPVRNLCCTCGSGFTREEAGTGKN